jgi:hypothetical protein
MVDAAPTSSYQILAYTASCYLMNFQILYLAFVRKNSCFTLSCRHRKLNWGSRIDPEAVGLAFWCRHRPLWTVYFVRHARIQLWRSPFNFYMWWWMDGWTARRWKRCMTCDEEQGDDSSTCACLVAVAGRRRNNQVAGLHCQHAPPPISCC